MSYSAYAGIEFNKNGKWECLVANVPDDLKKVHYAFGARGNSMPYVDADDFDDGGRDFSTEIAEEVNRKDTFGNKEYNVYNILGVTSWNKLVEIREKVFTEIKERPHKYKTVSRALSDLLDEYEDNENAAKVIPEIFKMSLDELKIKGFLDNEYAEDDYVELEYYFFALQYACDLIVHYVEEYNMNHKEYIEPENCRLVMWGC
jgi:hypothetical protein